MTTRENVGHHSIEEELLKLAGADDRFGLLAAEARLRAKQYLASEEYSRGELIESYKSVIKTLYREDRDEQAEELLEVMAELEGFCSPHARI